MLKNIAILFIVLLLSVTFLGAATTTYKVPRGKSATVICEVTGPYEVIYLRSGVILDCPK